MVGQVETLYTPYMLSRRTRRPRRPRQPQGSVPRLLHSGVAETGRSEGASLVPGWGMPDIWPDLYLVTSKPQLTERPTSEHLCTARLEAAAVTEADVNYI